MHPKDRKIRNFIVPIGHYEWIVMPFVLKNAPSEFQKGWMISLDPVSNFVLYIDDILVFCKNWKDHIDHLKQFYDLVYNHGPVLS